MATNAGVEYFLSEQKFREAKTTEEKILALEEMLRTAPHHKASGNLLKQIKQKLAKLRGVQEKVRAKKGSGKSLNIKREGAARIAIVGTTNSGKSTLLTKLTNAHPEIAEYEFTTKEPEVGIMDYNGINIQMIEVPALFENFIKSKRGPEFLNLIKESDLIILTYKNTEEKNLVVKELWNNNIDLPMIYYENIQLMDMKELIWKHLKLVYVFTKMPSKKPDFPPVALPKSSNIEDLANKIHKDFFKKFKFARIWGKSARFTNGQQVGLKHVLQDGDVIEFHMN
ncbi:TGS domain-containing protein [Candidatus Woesearchaeota archaeon]|nr:TGS domain-containing protein [Candidatus Woesearchaeota archaeon]